MIKIHKEQYSNESSIEDFNGNNFLSNFAVLEDDKLILAGAVRLIPEVLLITDKNLPVRTRRTALVKALQASRYIASRSGHSSIHAFVQDEIWLNQLLKHGFQLTAGKAVVTSSNQD